MRKLEDEVAHLSNGARRALINASDRHSSGLPTGTPPEVERELREACAIGRFGGLTYRGLALRDLVLSAALDELAGPESMRTWTQDKGEIHVTAVLDEQGRPRLYVQWPPGAPEDPRDELVAAARAWRKVANRPQDGEAHSTAAERLCRAVDALG